MAKSKPDTFFDWLIATRGDVRKAKEQIMEAITPFAARVNASFDALGVSVDGVQDDVTFLKEQIAILQNSSGTLTAEDQATLDAIQARADQVATKLAAIDAATERPPVPTP